MERLTRAINESASGPPRRDTQTPAPARATYRNPAAPSVRRATTFERNRALAATKRPRSQSPARHHTVAWDATPDVLRHHASVTLPDPPRVIPRTVQIAAAAGITTTVIAGVASNMPFVFVMLLMVCIFLAALTPAAYAAAAPRSLRAQIDARAHRRAKVNVAYAAVVDDSVHPVTVRVISSVAHKNFCRVTAVGAPVELTGDAETDVPACQAAAARAAELELGASQNQQATSAQHGSADADVDLLRAEGDAARYSIGQRLS
jgi:hypothetical protein